MRTDKTREEAVADLKKAKLVAYVNAIGMNGIVKKTLIVPYDEAGDSIKNVIEMLDGPIDLDGFILAIRLGQYDGSAG